MTPQDVRIRQPALLPSAMRLRDIEPRSNPSDLVAIGDKAKTNRDQSKFGPYNNWWPTFVNHACHFPAIVPSDHETPLVRDQGFGFCSLLSKTSLRH